MLLLEVGLVWFVLLLQIPGRFGLVWFVLLLEIPGDLDWFVLLLKIPGGLGLVCVILPGDPQVGLVWFVLILSLHFEMLQEIYHLPNIYIFLFGERIQLLQLRV